MDSWWGEIDEELLTTSGRVRIRSVEVTAPRVSKCAA